MTITPAPRVNAPVLPSQFGRTVRDAELLLRKAKFCYVFVRMGKKPSDVVLLQISRASLKKDLGKRAATSDLPSELQLDDYLGASLFIGGSMAIEAAEARR